MSTGRNGSIPGAWVPGSLVEQEADGSGSQVRQGGGELLDSKQRIPLASG
jgi:hypothetical protein